MPRSICGSCNKIFSSTGNFDSHRVGNFGEAIYKDEKQRRAKHTSGRTLHNRRCMTTDELLASGKFAVERKMITLYREGQPYQEERDIWYEPEAREKLRQAHANDDEREEAAD